MHTNRSVGMLHVYQVWPNHSLVMSVQIPSLMLPPAWGLVECPTNIMFRSPAWMIAGNRSTCRRTSWHRHYSLLSLRAFVPTTLIYAHASTHTHHKYTPHAVRTPPKHTHNDIYKYLDNYYSRGYIKVLCGIKLMDADM